MTMFFVHRVSVGGGGGGVVQLLISAGSRLGLRDPKFFILIYVNEALLCAIDSGCHEKLLSVLSSIHDGRRRDLRNFRCATGYTYAVPSHG